MEIEPGTEIPAQALLFDMDGTLLDSSDVIAGIWRRWAARHGVDPDIVLLASHGRRVIETITTFAPAGADVAAEAAFLARAAADEAVGPRPVPGAAALLGALPVDRWAVVTSAERDVAGRWMRQAGLPLPGVLVTAEDVTAGKPDPEGYLLAAARLGVAPAEAVVFEDAPSGIAAGRAAGAYVVAMATTLTGQELGLHPWLRDFSRVMFHVAPGQRPVLRIVDGGPAALRRDSIARLPASEG